jgi:MFS family permease
MRRSTSTETQGGLSRLLRTDGWAKLFVAYAFSRMSAGTVGFSLLLIGQKVQHNLAHGAVAVTGYALAAAVAGPAIARAADSRGPRRILLVTSAMYATALVAVALTAPLGPVWLTLSATVAGAVMPPIGPTFRATLTQAVPDPALRSTALTVESMLVEGIQVVGPFLVTACVAIIAPQLALVIIAASVLLGTLVLTALPALRARPVVRSTGSARLITRPVLRIITIWLVFTGALSAMEVLAVSFAGPSRVWLSGLSVAVLAGGSILGGIVVATRPLPGRPARQLQLLLVSMALAVVGLFLARTPQAFVFAMGVAALVVAPSMGIIMTLLGQAVPASRRHEAFGWMASANYVGGAAWTAGAGVLVVHGNGAAVALTCGSLLVGAALALKVGSPSTVPPAPVPPALPPLPGNTIVLPEPRPARVLEPAGPLRATGAAAGGR